MPKSTAPKSATQDDEELPQTAVKPRGKELLIQQMQDRLASYEEAHNPDAEAPAPKPADDETFKKRYGDLRRHAQQKEADYTKEINTLKSQLAQLQQANDAPMPKTLEEFEAWKNRYPDIVKFIEIIADERSNAAKKQLQEELGSVKEKLTETEKEKAFTTLKLLVPDLDDIVASGAYKNWYRDQPPFITEVLDTSDDPHKIAYYLNIFKAAATPKKKERESRLDALETSPRSTGASTTGNSRWRYTQSQIAKMTTEQYTKEENDILAARAAGQILDDVSRHNTVFDGV